MTSPDETAEDIQRDEERARAAAQLHYANAAEFLADRLIHLVPLPPPESGLVWCPSWYRHAQAISRIDSIWRAWEHLRFDAAVGMSNWWTHYADPNMRALMDPVSGPFARCVNGHQTPVPLPLEQVPDGLFDDARLTWPTPIDPLALE